MCIFTDRETILVLNGDTPDEEKQRIFQNIKEESSRYLFFLTTSTLSIGVDINTDHYKSAVGVFSRNCASI